VPIPQRDGYSSGVGSGGLPEERGSSSAMSAGGGWLPGCLVLWVVGSLLVTDGVPPFLSRVFSIDTPYQKVVGDHIIASAGLDKTLSKSAISCHCKTTHVKEFKSSS
jgi:hypothetical protein